MQNNSINIAGTGLSVGLRRWLLLTALLCGASILVIEILGAKMLAPYFGTSHFVWTAQISVTLISLAVGYWFGGWMADRSCNPGRLYASIAIAGSYLCLTVPLCRHVSDWCLNYRLALGSILASAFLFFVPLMLLATTGPFLIRVMISSVQEAGTWVGRLSALSTVGSVLGALMIGYVQIPLIPNSLTMYGTAIVILALSGGYFLIWGKSSRSKLLLLAGVLLGLGTGFAGLRAESRVKFDGMEELDRRNSPFGLMQVLQLSGHNRRYYMNDYLTQNSYDPENKRSMALFTYMLHGLARAYTTNIEQALCIGLGVGIVPMQLAHEGVKVDVVEINEAVIPLAQKYFDLEPDKLNITIGDGRHFLNRRQSQYDTIVLDAFLGDSSPSHLMTHEAFDAMRRAMKPGGTLVINSFGDLEQGRDFFMASLEKTLKSVFKSVRIHSGQTGNIFFVASDRTELSFVHAPDWSKADPAVVSQVETAYHGIIETNPDHGRVLTDDYNPVEFHDAANRERLRAMLARMMRPTE